MCLNFNHQYDDGHFQNWTLKLAWTSERATAEQNRIRKTDHKNLLLFYDMWLDRLAFFRMNVVCCGWIKDYANDQDHIISS